MIHFAPPAQASAGPVYVFDPRLRTQFCRVYLNGKLVQHRVLRFKPAFDGWVLVDTNWPLEPVRKLLWGRVTGRVTYRMWPGYNVARAMDTRERLRRSLQAGEELRAGDPVYVGEDGRAYRVCGPEHAAGLDADGVWIDEFNGMLTAADLVTTAPDANINNPP